MPVALAALIGGAVGVVLLLPTCIRGVSRLLRNTRFSGVRFGARVAERQSSAFAPMALTIAAFLRLAGVGQAITVGIRLDGVGDLTQVNVDVQLGGVSERSREALRGVVAPVKVVSVGTDADASRDFASVFVADSSSMEAESRDRQGDATCSAQPMRLTSGLSGGALSPQAMFSPSS